MALKLSKSINCDFSRFYYDLAVELTPFYRRVDEVYSNNKVWPFFRFIHADGTYLAPPEARGGEVQTLVRSLPGIMSPFSEPELRRRLSGLKTIPGESLRARTGFLVGKLDGEAYLLKGFVCPVVDAFGEFLGDLVMVLPWADPIQRSDGVYAGVMINSLLFPDGAAGAPALWSQLEQRLEAGEGLETIRRVESGEAEYLMFTSEIRSDAAFPRAYQVTAFSLAEQERLQKSISGVLLMLSVGGLLFSALISLFLAKGLSRPVERLKDAAEKVGRGDFNVQLKVPGRDEIGRLTQSFNKMTEGLAQKERYKAVLSKVADAKVADRLMQGTIDMHGETVEATVLFCDIRGFIALSEGMDPQELITLLNAHMTAMTEVVYAFGGVVDKYVGDELMVLFGAPLQAEDDVERAYQCAKRMIERRRELNAQMESPLTIGIGMAHGLMVAGCMGSETRLNYTVLGDRVNLAARLCSQAGPMEIVVDAAVRQRIGTDLDTAESRALPLKGFVTAPPFYVIKSQKS